MREHQPSLITNSIINLMQNYEKLLKKVSAANDLLEHYYFMLICNNRSKTKKEAINYCYELIGECKTSEDVKACRRAIRSYLSPFGYDGRKDLIKLRESLKDKAFEIDFGHLVNTIKAHEKATALAY